jgi:hypothetical protein
VENVMSLFAVSVRRMNPDLAVVNVSDLPAS